MIDNIRARLSDLDAERAHLESDLAQAKTEARDATVEAMKQSGIETLDIPAFLRKQAD
jgi:cell division protein FtsZ